MISKNKSNKAKCEYCNKKFLVERMILGVCKDCHDNTFFEGLTRDGADIFTYKEEGKDL